MISNVLALEPVRTLHRGGKPDRAEVEAAIRTIIRWSADNPDREGLIETPARVTRALEEAFIGYTQDPVATLQKSFDEIEGYDEMVVLRGIRFESHCEHHMAPILGRAWVAYVPDGRVVGISKLARVVEAYAKRLQIQEKLTAQIANTINDVLRPRGVGVIIRATHHCMTTRGVHKTDTDLVTSRMLGCFRDNPQLRQEFLAATARRQNEATMAQEQVPASGPDLTQGVTLSDLVDGRLVGQVGNEEVLLVRAGSELFAIGAHCSHYHGPLADGVVTGETVRCPWHHACFDLRSGEALRAPALSPVECWKVEQHAGRIFVKEKRAQPEPRQAVTTSGVGRIVIVGGGAAGFAAAEMLRRRGFGGSLSMLSQDDVAPVDRPNLSKDYLAGSAPEDWLPLRPDRFYAENDIDLRLDTAVVGINAKTREVVLADGERLIYDRLLLATGAEPVRLPIPGADQPHVYTLRSLADCRAIIRTTENARRALVIGASFIGLEAAAALRTRNIEIHVVAPEARPMERVLGAEMGDFIRALHEEHGVVFHLQDTVTAINGTRAMLKSGGTLDADFVVIGVGVRPRLVLAEQAGLVIDRGVTVNDFLETSARGVYAAGDIARWPDPHSGGNIRVEHWVVAERQGQTAAANMLGLNERFDAVPFFWSQHYDVPINYVGHAEQWDEITVDGDIKAKDCVLRYKRNGRVLAVASIFRDVDNLQAELSMELAAASRP